MRYTVIFEPEAEEGFHVWCPALKGCHSQVVDLPGCYTQALDLPTLEPTCTRPSELMLPS
jgi:predicted RNase H-like HicB family nuclease